MRRIKNEVHRWVDPWLARPSHQAYQRILAGLPDGEYRLPFEVPYVSQFASPELINDYIHHNFDGTQDPNWPVFGAEKPQDYAFWANRVCALACLKMAIEAYHTTAPTLWQLVQEGLAFNGYRLYDGRGHWIDEGWYVEAQAKLAAKYGLTMRGHSYASPLGICQKLRDGILVAAAVTAELGEQQFQTRRYAGHLVLVLGFRWQKGKPTAYQVHNPSGRYSELRASAWIPAKRFHRAYAYRFTTIEADQFVGHYPHDNECILDHGPQFQ